MVPDDIGWAVDQMRQGQKVRRRGWNGKGMWLELETSEGNSQMSLPYVFMVTPNGDMVPWVCSQTDLLATDWELAD